MSEPSEAEIEAARKRIEKAQRIAEVGGRRVLMHELKSAGRWLVKNKGPNRKERRSASKVQRDEHEGPGRAWNAS